MPASFLRNLELAALPYMAHGWLVGGMIRASGFCSTAEHDFMLPRCVAWRWASLKYAGTVMTA